MAGDMELIQRVTLSSPGTVTFASIPSTYTDLKLEFVGSTGNGNVGIRFNNDAATNYSSTYLLGDGTSASSGRVTNVTSISMGVTNNGNAQAHYRMEVFSYASPIYKTTLSSGSGDENGSGRVTRTSGLWRSTAAITSLTIINTVNTGTVVTLFGVK